MWRDNAEEKAPDQRVGDIDPFLSALQAPGDRKVFFLRPDQSRLHRKELPLHSLTLFAFTWTLQRPLSPLSHPTPNPNVTYSATAPYVTPSQANLPGG
ncbi:unnamed protein product [Gadus morhua 'NCC']